MKIDLISEYKNLAAICAKTDYADMTSIKVHNKAISKMYRIVELISKDLSLNYLDKFFELLHVRENRTNLWAAIHILEKLSPEIKTEKKALEIINSFAKGDSAEALGFQLWLKNREENQAN